MGSIYGGMEYISEQWQFKHVLRPYKFSQVYEKRPRLFLSDFETTRFDGVGILTNELSRL